MINKETAKLFNNDINDGFVQPFLAWCATNPEHINNNISSSIFSNFWIGNPEEIKNFANKIANFYHQYIEDNNLIDSLNEDESVSVAYWENENIAMCAEFFTFNDFYDLLPDEFFNDTDQIKQVLSNGNDNHSGAIFSNEICFLSPAELISIACFMNKNSTEWIFNKDYEISGLANFSEQEIEKLKKSFYTLHTPKSGITP